MADKCPYTCKKIYIYIIQSKKKEEKAEATHR